MPENNIFQHYIKDLCSFRELWSHILDYSLTDMGMKAISVEKAGASPKKLSKVPVGDNPYT